MANEARERLEQLIHNLVALETKNYRIVRRLEHVYGKHGKNLGLYAVDMHNATGQIKLNMKYAIALVHLARKDIGIYSTVIQLIVDERAKIYRKKKPGPKPRTDSERQTQAEYMRNYRAQKKLLEGSKLN